MVSEQQVIKSRMVAERVVNALGLRLRIVEPAGLRRRDLFGDVPPMVDSTATRGDLRLTFGDRTYTLSSGAHPLRDGGLWRRRRRRRRPISSSRNGPDVRGADRAARASPDSRRPRQSSADRSERRCFRRRTSSRSRSSARSRRSFATSPTQSRASTPRCRARCSARMPGRRAQFIASSLRDQRARLDSAQDALKDFKERRADRRRERRSSPRSSQSIHRMEEAQQVRPRGAADLLHARRKARRGRHRR